MSEGAVFDWYRNTIKQIKVLRENIDSGAKDAKQQYDALTESIAIMKMVYPEMQARYDRLLRIQSTFTAEQIDFICYQIGDWYLKWKTNIVTGEGKQHRLGFAKEQLKTMICGE